MYRACESNREVLHGAGADGVGVKFPIFSVNCCCLPLSIRRRGEKRRKRGKMRENGGKMRKKGENHSHPIYIKRSDPQKSETGRIRFRRVRFQTPNSVSFFGPHRVPGRELSELLSPYYLCAKGNSPSFSQNSPSLAQNSVSSLFRNSTLETVFRPFPKKD